MDMTTFAYCFALALSLSIGLTACYDTTPLIFDDLGKIPCRFENPLESVLLVRWHKTNETTHTSGNRVAFWNLGEPTPTVSENYNIDSNLSLIIQGANGNNDGLFYCYVVFKGYPPSTYFIRLVVIGQRMTSVCQKSTQNTPISATRPTSSNTVNTEDNTIDGNAGENLIITLVLPAGAIAFILIVVLLRWLRWSGAHAHDANDSTKPPCALKQQPPCEGSQMDEEETHKRRITKDQLMKVANMIPPGKYIFFCFQVGLSHDYAMTLLVKHMYDRSSAILELLVAWSERDNHNFDDLKGLLESSEMGDLIKYLE